MPADGMMTSLQSPEGVRYSPFGDRHHAVFAPLIFCIMTALVGWYLIISMFYRFHGVRIERHRIALLYLWPRSAELIERADLVQVKLVRGARPCGHMEITRRTVFERELQTLQRGHRDTEGNWYRPMTLIFGAYSHSNRLVCIPAPVKIIRLSL